MATADSSNSYITVAAADIYFDARLHADAWNDADPDNKERAVIQATRVLDTYLVWYETPDKTDPDPAIMDATCEMALVLLAGDTQVKNDMEGLESVGLKGMNVKARGRKSVVPKHVFVIVSHLATIKSTTTGVVRS